MNSRVAQQWQISYFQVHLKILPTSGTVQSPNSRIPDLTQWLCAYLSAPPQARSLQHFPKALQWSSVGLENSSGTKLTSITGSLVTSYPTYYGGPLVEGPAKQ